MANFLAHIAQAKRNLSFLGSINRNNNDNWDWQVTVSFYTAVHLISALIADTNNLHYDSHTDTLAAINPAANGAQIGITEDIYLAYRKLFNDSIRSRYLTVHRDEKAADYSVETAYITHSKHFKKCIVRLNTILNFISDRYQTEFPETDIDCIDLRKEAAGLKYFNYRQMAAA